MNDELPVLKTRKADHDEIAALKAELERAAFIIGTYRAALEAINRPFDITMTGLETANLLREIARRAVKGNGGGESSGVQAALDGRAATIALHKILNLAQHGTPPDYQRWISTLDNIAEIAHRALEGK